MDSLGKEITLLKEKLEILEQDIVNDTKIVTIPTRNVDEEIEELINSTYDIIKLNIGGKIFTTKKETLMRIRDSVFEKLLTSDRFENQSEIFFDRSYRNFKYILNYLRTLKFEIESFDKKQLKEIYKDAAYYEIQPLMEILSDYFENITFIGFEFNAPYVYSENTVGKNNIEFINNFEDRTLMNGICATYPGWIIFELEKETKINEIEIGGYCGEQSYFSPTNGAGAIIYTSRNKSNWKNVGTLPSDYGGKIQSIRVESSNAKYVKFQHTSYLGIGYFKIIKK